MQRIPRVRFLFFTVVRFGVFNWCPHLLSPLTGQSFFGCFDFVGALANVLITGMHVGQTDSIGAVQRKKLCSAKRLQDFLHFLILYLSSLSHHEFFVPKNSDTQPVLPPALAKTFCSDCA